MTRVGQGAGARPQPLHQGLRQRRHAEHTRLLRHAGAYVGAQVEKQRSALPKLWPQWHVVGGSHPNCRGNIVQVPVSVRMVVSPCSTVNITPSRCACQPILYSLFMSAASSDQPGTDFTVLACAQLVVYLAGSSAAGVIADRFGYQVLFGLATAISAVSVLVTWRMLSREPVPERQPAALRSSEGGSS